MSAQQTKDLPGSDLSDKIEQLCRRYYICDNKLNTLGWREQTSWEEGLKKTIDWYLQHGFKEFWDNGDVEAALQPHPVMHPQQMLSGAAVTTP